MKRMVLASLSYAAVLCLVGGSQASRAQSQQPEAANQQNVQQNVQQLGDIQFRLPPGLLIERVAESPLIHWPVVADWDQAGRLVVVESAGVERPIEEHNLKLLHRIVRLVDEDQDGKFDRRLVAADHLPFAQGVLCLGKDMLVAAPPHIWKLTDVDGDGFCESREIWFDGQTITGCANDLHGPYLGRDGWIYWCKGAFAEQTHEWTNGETRTDSAAHIYRRKLEGGPVEAVMSGGMDNPVELAVTPEGERFFTSTFLQHPGNGLRDGVAHAIYGGVYGKEHSVIEGLMRTGPLMPIMTQLGPAAPSGLICLESNAATPFATDHSSRVLLAALFNLQKVSAHRLHAEGATYRTEDVDLLVADRIDFHPTDILEDADGSILVVDTGGWYDLCCPTSRIDQKTADGGIYRIRRTSTKPMRVDSVKIVDWSKQTADDCVRSLQDPRPWVQRMALLRLRELGDQAVQPLASQLNDARRSVDDRLRVLWSLSFVGTDRALTEVAYGLDSNPSQLQQAACQALSAHRFRPAKAALSALLPSSAQAAATPSVVRAACEALGRMGDRANIPALMRVQRWQQVDATLAHSSVYAMLELSAAEDMVEFLDSPWPAERVAAMRVLQQLGKTELIPRASVIAAFLREGDERALAIEILSERPEWIGDALNELPFPSDKLLELKPLFVAWQDVSQLHERMAAWLDSSTSSDEASPTQDSVAPAKASRPSDQHELGGPSVGAWERSMTQVFQMWEGLPLPEACVEPMVRRFAADPELVGRLLREVDLSIEYCRPLREAIERRIVASDHLAEQQFLLELLPPNQSFADASLSQSLVEQYVRESADQRSGPLLRRMVIGASQATTIVESLSAFEASQLPLAIELASSTNVDRIDMALLESLPSLPAARALPGNFLENNYRRRSSELQALAAATAQSLAAPPEDIARAVDERSASLPEGNAIRGLQIFRSSKASCSSCHQMGYVGGKIGPDLTRIGASRTRAALLEAILFPSSRIEQSYHSAQVLTVDGDTYNGIIIASSERGLRLQLAVNQTIDLQHAEIEAQKPSTISVMPAGMVEILDPQELADLLSLLESAR